MRRVLALILLILGIGALISAGVNAKDAPNLAYLIGTFLPGPLLIVIAVLLDRRTRTTQRRR